MNNSEIVYNGFLKVFKLNTNLGIREVCVRPDAVTCVIYDDKNVLLISQDRAGEIWNGENSKSLEAPAGMIDEGETPHDAVKREILEEVGLKIDSLRYYGYCYPSPGGLSERIHLFSAKIDDLWRLQPQAQNDEDEKIQIHIVPRNTATLDMKTAFLLSVINN